MRDRAPEDAPKCLEAQVMDWADNVAYSVHDVEDGPESDRSTCVCSPTTTPAPSWGLLGESHGMGGGLSADDLMSAAVRLSELPVVAAIGKYDATLAASVELKKLTSELVGRFASAAIAATRAEGGPRPPRPLHRRPAGSGVVARRGCGAEGAGAAGHLSDPGLWRFRAASANDPPGGGLALGGAPASLDPIFVPAFNAADDDGGRLRVVIDQIASFTEGRWSGWNPL